MTAAARRLVSLFGSVAVLAALVGLTSTSTVASALTVAVVAAAFCHAGAVIVRAVGAARAAVWAVSVRESASHTAFLPLRDPDAAGRVRPRAPGFGVRGLGVAYMR